MRRRSIYARSSFSTVNARPYQTATAIPGVEILCALPAISMEAEAQRHAYRNDAPLCRRWLDACFFDWAREPPFLRRSDLSASACASTRS